MTLELTDAQKAALVGLLLEYITNASLPESNLSMEFAYCGQNPPITVSVVELLDLLTQGKAQ